ncbi:MAG: GH3 auxin-responsive promoter family protein [Bacteroidota bacterium]|nr:GH3 auxin-responsive promoter family protein [Bacteroidota bacterium]
MALINSVVSWLMKKRFHQIEFFITYPHDVQEEWFKRLISAGSQTAWGKEFGYPDISNVEQFKKQVPVNDYDKLRPYIERLRNGEQFVLWNTEVKWFAKSSGTTSDKSKFIPVSNEALEECHFKGGKDLLSIYCSLYPDTKLFSGKGLAMGGSHSISEIDNEEFLVGDLSAILIENLPNWAEFIRVPKKKLALHDKWEEKIEMMARATIPHKVTNVSGVPSWTLLLLKRVLEITGKDNIAEVWPELEVFFHGGVNFEPYKEQFRGLIQSPGMRYMETYNASEGFFGIQDMRDSREMLLMLDYGIYYEFMPMEELGKDHPRTLRLDEVETGVNYALIISTNGGLWRYMIGDTIQFTGLSPYRIRITGRTKNFINAVGEEVIVENAEQAILQASRETGATVTEFTAAPVYFSKKDNAAHEWLIEFEKQPDKLEAFTLALDKCLQTVNSDYEAKRYKDMVLRKPLVQSVPKGTFYNWMKSRGKLGGQNKVPRLSNNRKHLESILSMLEAND